MPCCAVGFTTRSDQADPEDVGALLRPYHPRLRAEIERLGGDRAGALALAEEASGLPWAATGSEGRGNRLDAAPPRPR